VSTKPLVPTWGHVYWSVWAIGSFVTFIAPEVYALATNWRNTLSSSVWDFERFRTGQPIYQWSAGHFLFVLLLLVIDVWLLGHFAFGIWR
jgi:hypothetical protein